MDGPQLSAGVYAMLFAAFPWAVLFLAGVVYWLSGPAWKQKQ